MSRTQIGLAITDEDIAACYPVISELRPHLSKEGFVALVRHLGKTTGFQLACLSDGHEIMSVAGYRISEWLAGGKYLELEDFVSKASARSRGYGAKLFDWISGIAAAEGCNQLRLVSNVRRVAAHRFYLRKGMSLEAYYFSINVKQPDHT
jgi:GNAT superfamily N-acetyltransferase